MNWEDDVSTCDRWGADVLLDYAQERLPEPQRADVAAHLVSCAACRQSIDELAVIATFPGAPSPEPGAEAERAIFQALRGKPARPGTRRIRFFRRASAGGRPGLLWAGAAAALFVIALLFAIVPAPRKAAAPPQARVEEPPPEPPRVSPPPIPERPPIRPPPATPLPEPPPVRPPEPTPPAPPPTPVKPPPSEPVPPRVVSPLPPTRVDPAPVFARVVQMTGRPERGGKPLAVGDPILSGEALACPTGSLLLETADRSRLALRAGTRCTVRLEGEHVLVALAEGETACSVTPRPERRFVVETAHGTTTVKGTVFSVRHGSTATTVTVTRGRVEARSEAGATEIAAGHRCSMTRAAVPRSEPVPAEKALSWAADAGLTVSSNVWILATSPAAEFQAPMTRDRTFAAGSLSGEPLFAAVDSRTLPAWNGRSLPAQQAVGGWVTFTVELPEAGTWHLWGRFYHPGSGTTLWRQDAAPRENDPNSFFASVDGGRESVFGNHKQDPETKTSWYRRWHWGGDGSIEVGRPAPLALGTLAKGRHTIRIRNRDAVETSSLHLAPRLDALCLTPDREYRPRDEDFRK